MITRSIYPFMETDALSIPNDANIKLLIRHSIKDTHLQTNGINDQLLTKEGEICAQYFGRHIQYELGVLYSSNFKRCIQTIENILIGRQEKRTVEVEDYLLGSLVCPNSNLCQNVIKELGLKEFLSKMVNNSSIQGFPSLDNCMKEILDFIFQTGNKQKTIDIYCTHDIHIAMIISQLFNLTLTKDIKNNWPMMLEGMYLWGKRNNFYCTWRGSRGHFTDYAI